MAKAIVIKFLKNKIAPTEDEAILYKVKIVYLMGNASSCFSKFHPSTKTVGCMFPNLATGALTDAVMLSCGARVK